MMSSAQQPVSSRTSRSAACSCVSRSSTCPLGKVHTGGSPRPMIIGRGEPPVWTLPKGHVELRETHEQAALREVREETGCWAELIIKLSDISYWFYLNGAKHKKSVHFYLMRY